MASVRRVAGGGWRVQVSVSVPGGKALRDSETLPTYREAVQWGARRDAELRASVGQVRGMTLGDALRRYSAEVSPLKRGWRWEQLRLAAWLADPAFPAALALAGLSAADLVRWRDARARVVQAGSVIRDFNLLSAVLETARRDWHWMAANVAAEVRRPRAPAHRERLVSWREVRAVCRALGYVHGRTPRSVREAVAVCFMLALHTGMRSGELLGLAWDDVHPRHVRLAQTKNGQAREVPLSRRARALLATLRGFHPERVFGLTQGTRDALFRQARERAGLDGFTFHDARHNAATRIGRKVGKAQGISFVEFCKMFGWSDPKFAMVYCNPRAEDVAGRL